MTSEAADLKFRVISISTPKIERLSTWSAAMECYRDMSVPTFVGSTVIGGVPAKADLMRLVPS